MRAVAIGLVIVLLLISLNALIKMTTLVGAPHPAKDGENENSLEVEEHGKFAVDEHNRNKDGNLIFKKVVSYKTQVVSGTMYHLTIEALDKNEPKQFEAKVWSKPWDKFKELKDFKPVSESVSSGDREVATDDPMVQEAAEHAVKGLQQKSNSLTPYTLKLVTEAKAQVLKDLTQLDIVMNVQRGVHEEYVKAQLHRVNGGQWTLKNVHSHQ